MAVRKAFKPVERLSLPIAVVLGLLIAYVDSRPTWDDTAVTLAALLASSGAIGFLAPRRPWLVGLAVGVWVPLVEIPGGHGYAPLIALGVALVGAYGGAAIRTAVGPASTTS